MGKGWSMSSVLLSSAYGDVECATEAYGPCRVCY